MRTAAENLRRARMILIALEGQLEKEPALAEFLEKEGPALKSFLAQTNRGLLSWAEEVEDASGVEKPEVVVEKTETW